jgi:hypothetical protein
VIPMRSRANGVARRPKDALAAKRQEPAAGQSGSLGQHSPKLGRAHAQARVAGTAPDRGRPLSERLLALSTLSLGDLRLEWRRLYRADAPRLSRDIMVRAIAYRLQEVAQGGLSKATLRRLATLAAEFESSGTIATSEGPRIKSGSRLVREWHGRTHVVTVSDAGFEFDGAIYKSLTKIAQDITGARWSGPRFFGLAKAPGGGRAKEVLGRAPAHAEGANG